MMWSSKAMPALFLVMLILSAVVIGIRQQGRSLFTKLEELHAERDALNIEWGRLLLEEGTWSQHHRVETTARQRLDMVTPAPDQVVVIQRTLRH